MAADMNITMGQADAWVNKVEAEITEVNLLLDKVVTCVKENEESDDTIYKELTAAAEHYNTAWTNLKKGYKNVFEALRHAFKAQAEAVNDALERVKREARKAKS